MLNIKTVLDLMIRYPLMKQYIRSCYERQAHQELVDFLFAIETTNQELEAGQ